jgi:hypothetical protein
MGHFIRVKGIFVFTIVENIRQREKCKAFRANGIDSIAIIVEGIAVVEVFRFIEESYCSSSSRKKSARW